MSQISSPLNLPKLRVEHNFGSPAGPGDWGPPGDSNLKVLADALAVEVAGMRLSEIKSVPHIWGHVIMFESALLEESHPGHEDAVGQWRALLAMLALRKFDPGYALSSYALGLEQEGTGKQVAPTFAQAAGKEALPPKICERKGSAWYLLGYRGIGTETGQKKEVLVGLLSPSTIVAPARNFRAEDFFGKENLGGQFWANSKYGLRDPLDCKDKLSYDALCVCEQYAQNL